MSPAERHIGANEQPCLREHWRLFTSEDAADDVGSELGKPHQTRERLRSAALNASIEALVDWKPVAAGDVIYSPPGTAHAIAAGLALIEMQRNVDLTYRLYNYDRPRELHLDAGIAVSDPVPYVIAPPPHALERGRTILVAGPKFVLERWRGGVHDVAEPDALLVPVTGGGLIGAVSFTAGERRAIDARVAIRLGDSGDALFACPGGTVRP